MDRISYSLGMSVARNMLRSGIFEIDFNDFEDGLKAVMSGAKPALGDEEVDEVLQKFFRKLSEERLSKAEKISKVMKERGEKFLKANAGKEGVVVLPDGLQYKVLREGRGRKPKASDKVRCNYEGRFPDGTVFDSSYERGEPAEFGLDMVIEGWTEGLQLMNEGSEYEFYIPYNLAYGESGAGSSIPPFAALVFKVELIKVL